MCDWRDCQRPGRWNPVLCVKAIGHPDGAEARAVIGVKACDWHALELRIEDVLSDKAWESVVKGFKAGGLAEPDRATARIEWVRDKEEKDGTAVSDRGN